MLSSKTGFRDTLRPKGEANTLRFATDLRWGIAGNSMEIGHVWAGDTDVVLHDAEVGRVLPVIPRHRVGDEYFTTLYNAAALFPG